MDNSVNQRFSSRIGLLLSALGIAVGTGNIWRFPRIAAQNGGEEGAGALILAWIIFLLLWSIPLIITEYLIGRKYRYGVVGAFVKGIGTRYAWMGGFVAFVATAISFFYAVITGWALYYFFRILFWPLPATTEISVQVWEGFQQSCLPFVLHFAAITGGIIAIRKGVRSIESINKILIPILILIILAAVTRSLFLPGALDGVRYLFTIEWGQLKTPEIWLQALTQNAWDTGAGWGLFLCYAAYMQHKHGVVKNAFITGFGNNIISLLMAIMIFGTVFSLMQNSLGYSDKEVLEVMQTSGPASTGLTFIWMPQLFALMPGGKILAIFFFLGLSFAGFSSLMSMLELSSRTLIDRGISRKKAVWVVGAIVYLLGIPSAMSLDVLSNQDFVWGLGLMISGVFIAVFAITLGFENLSTSSTEITDELTTGKWWRFLIHFFIPPAGILLLCWWLWLSFTQFAPDNWYNPFSGFSPMTVLVQWGIIIILLIVFNKQISKLQNP
jgi:neurotransmitter:Na+ symporter, NSS family